MKSEIGKCVDTKTKQHKCHQKAGQMATTSKEADLEALHEWETDFENGGGANEVAMHV